MVIRITIYIASVPNSKQIDETGTAKGSNRNAVDLTQQLVDLCDLLFIIRFKKQTAGFPLYTVNRQDVDFKHTKH
ncbi:hypothetical protein D3C71_2135260 [compost metagenome]